MKYEQIPNIQLKVAVFPNIEKQGTFQFSFFRDKNKKNSIFFCLNGRSERRFHAKKVPLGCFFLLSPLHYWLPHLYFFSCGIRDRKMKSHVSFNFTHENNDSQKIFFYLFKNRFLLSFRYRVYFSMTLRIFFWGF